MLRRIWKCRRGVAMVETALVMPVLVLLVIGTIEFALLFFTHSSMQTAARDIGRQVAVNFLPIGNAEAAIRGQLPGWSQAGTAVTVRDTVPGDPTRNNILVTLSVPASAATPLPFFTRAAGAWTLTTTVELKQELPL